MKKQIKIFYNPLKEKGCYLYSGKGLKFLARVKPKKNTYFIEPIRQYDNADFNAAEGAKFMREVGDWFLEEEFYPEKMPEGVPNFMISHKIEETPDGKAIDYIFSGSKDKEAILIAEEIEMADLLTDDQGKEARTLFFSSLQTGLPEFYDISIETSLNLSHSKRERVLKDAVKWYKSYLIQEDKQTLEQQQQQAIEPILADYNEQVKGLKIARSATTQKHLAIFRGRVKLCSTENEVFQWLKQKFKLTDKQLERGFVTEFI